jgi:hypothetical protein
MFMCSRRGLRSLVMAFLVAAAVGPTRPSAAQSFTSFAYQGRIEQNAAAVQGVVDLRFRLYEGAAGGSPLGLEVQKTNVAVNKGVFITTMDFGEAFSPGELRWLEIDVRTPGSGDYVTLSPRQLVSSTPLALGIAGIPTTPAGPLGVDQAQISGGTSYSTVDFTPCWQSFTAGRTGLLQRLDLRAITGSASGSSTLTVKIRSGVGLSGPVLASATQSVDEEFAQRVFTFTNLVVESGQQYTIDFSGESLVARAVTAIPGAAGSNSFGSQNWWFRTYLQGTATIDARASSAIVALTAQSAATATQATDAVNAQNAANAQNAVSAQFATNAQNAVNAQFANSATSATSAQVAANVSWQGLTGQPAINSPGAIGAGWQLQFTNGAVPSFRGGLRLSDSGFFEITNTALNPSPSFARLSSTGTWSAVSDARLKTDIRSSAEQLETALKLRPVNFRWKESGAEDFGLIAQEVRQVMPTLVLGDERSQTLTVNYAQLSVLAIGAIQELSAKTQQLENDVRLRDKHINDLEAQLANLESRLKALERQDRSKAE